ncbi:DUF3180 family protein [Nocardioides sp.]|uniref:DUF3180 family protein n=1 Tax=Nocardioides sp. TaxID=35761 RepID=UPI003519B5CB
MNRSERPGGMSTLPPRTLLPWAVAGLAAGWLLHPVSDAMGTPPVVATVQVVGLYLAVALLAILARSTWRAVQVHRRPLEPGDGLNRLLLARACAYVGALIGGGYLGYGLSWVGDPAERADERLVGSLLAALAGLLLALVALVLERACRIDPPDQDPPTDLG